MVAADALASIVLHSGTEHPELWWVVIAAVISFAAGLGIGSFSDRIRGWIGARTTSAAE